MKDCKGAQGNLGVMKMFYNLIWVVATLLY